MITCIQKKMQTYDIAFKGEFIQRFQFDTCCSICRYFKNYLLYYVLGSRHYLFPVLKLY